MIDSVKDQAGIPYVTQNAILRCPFGLMTSILTVVDPTRASIGFNKMATIQDKAPMVNIPPFGMCTSILNPAVQSATIAAMGTLTPAPCPGVQAITGWIPPLNNVVNKTSRYITKTCTLLCSFGGNIQVVHSGQGVSAPIAVPCKPLESNYELPGWLEATTTIASLTPWGAGLNVVEALGKVYNGKYVDAAVDFIPFKKVKKVGGLLKKPADKVLGKMGTNTGEIAQKVEGVAQKAADVIDNSTIGKKAQAIADSRVGRFLNRDIIGNSTQQSVGKNTMKNIGDTADNIVEKGVSDKVKSWFKSDEPERYETNADIAKAATGLPPDEFDAYL